MIFIFNFRWFNSWFLHFLVGEKFKGCFTSEGQKKQAETLFRYVALLIILATGTYTLFHISKFSEKEKSQEMKYWSYVYKESIACLAVFLITVVPEICHEEFKVLVQFCCGVACLTIPLAFMQDSSLTEETIEILTAFQVGGVFSFFTWLTTLLVCTDKNRLRCLFAVRSIPYIGEICSRFICCTVNEYSSIDSNDDHAHIV